MNNSSDNTVWQFRYGGFNGAIHLLIQFVVVELFKCKSKMSALPTGWAPPVLRWSVFERESN